MPRDESSSIDPRVGVGAVVGICIGLPLLSAFVSGAIGIPHNDDWAFYRIVFDLAQTGGLHLVGWNEMMFLGQLVWATPLATVFGDSITAIVVVSALISGGGLVLTYLLARRFLPIPYALVTAFAVGIFPGFAALVTTFMTDPIAYTAQVGCLVLGVRALDRVGNERLVALIACLSVGLFGFSIREFAIAAPISVAVGLWVVERRERRFPGLSIGALAATVTGAAALYWWRHTFPGDTSHFFGLQVGTRLLVHMSQTYFTLALGLIPALVFLAISKRGEIRRLVTILAMIPLPWAFLALLRSAGAPTCCLGGSGSVFVGNLLTERGILGNQALAGDRPALFPFVIWLVLSAAAVIAGSLLAGWLETSLARIRRRRPLDPAVVMLATFGALNAALIVFRAVLGGPTFDRYLITLVLVGTIMLLRGQSTLDWKQQRVAIIATGVLAVGSLMLVTSGHTYEAARWTAAEIAVDSGIPAGNVDGGFEWAGFHYDGPTMVQGASRPMDIGPGYMDMFPDAGHCAVVTSSPRDDPRLELIASVPYRTLLGLGNEEVWVYKFAEACKAEGLP